MGWIERVFAPGHILARTLLLLGCLAGYLAFLAPAVSARDWLLAMAALALSTAGRWTPLGAVLLQCALLGVSDLYGFAVTMPIKVLACVTLFELAVRRSPRQVAIGAGVLGVVVCFNLLDELPQQLPSALFRITIVVGVPLLLGSYVRMARQGEQRERERAEARVHDARQAERTAIARELHDLVAHHVSSMILRLGVARHMREEPDPLLDDLHATGTAALSDLRKLVEVLRDPGRGELSVVEPSALPAALDSAVEHGRRNGLDVRSNVDPGVGSLDAVRGFAVLRLIQEGLANSAKHAGPDTTVWLDVCMSGDGTVRLDLTDDGVPAGPKTGGHGLVGMRERVTLLGGHLEVGPAEPGWRMSAVLP